MTFINVDLNIGLMCVFSPGPGRHDGLPADLRPVLDQTEETHRQDDGHRAALRRRVPLCELPPHHQQVTSAELTSTSGRVCEMASAGLATACVFRLCLYL